VLYLCFEFRWGREAPIVLRRQGQRASKARRASYGPPPSLPCLRGSGHVLARSSSECVAMPRRQARPSLVPIGLEASVVWRK
jgi:hypothetical protein